MTYGFDKPLYFLPFDHRGSTMFGWKGGLTPEQTAQIEGIVDEPQGPELARLKAVYFRVYPDGVERQQWKDITYVRVRPKWVRYSDFRGASPLIVEWDEGELTRSEL